MVDIDMEGEFISSSHNPDNLSNETNLSQNFQPNGKLNVGEIYPTKRYLNHI